MVVVRHALVILVAGSLGYSGAAFGQALSSGDPPGRVGRLAFVQGTVSFHDAERTDWQPAMVNQPLTTGDAVWTEPNAHSEISIAGTRVRLDGATQLDMLALDDRQTRLQIDQGRVDIKTVTFDARQPYELATPRGVAALQQQGDYYVESGSTNDPTRLGVRQGAAQFQAPDGRVLAVRAGEVVEITGDGSSMELHTIQAPPPPMPQYWAERDRIVAYDQPPQYLSAGITGYEDLNYYGSWTNDPQYGQVWYVRDAPSGWAPYTTGRWVSEPVYGWTWVDEQPWGFAPYHYGRWAQRNNRWFWVPPERSQPAIYAPALVAFVGGTELGMALGTQSRAPVGWFPLGPREVYVPPYTSNRDYYRRLNLSARVQDNMLNDRWDRIQRREAIADQTWMNRRYATVVPAEAFARSQPVQSVTLRVAPEKIAAVPVAAVSVPPSPTVSVRALQAPATATAPASGQPPRRPGEPNATTTPQAQPNATASVQAQPAMQAIKPEPQQKTAPGPQVVSRSAVTTNTDAKAALPKLEPRNASAPPLPQIQGERKPASTQPGPQQATAPATQPATPPKPGDAPKPGEPQANAPANRPGVPTLPGEQNKTQPAQPGQPGQATLPPVRDRNGQRPEPPRPGQPQANTQPNAATPNAQPPKPVEPPKPGQQATPQPSKPGEPPKPPQAQSAPAPQPATPSAPQRQATPAPQPPQPQHQVTPPSPPPQQHQATPPAPQPQQQLQRAPQPSAPPQPSQSHAAPPPQPQAPPQQAHAPAPQPQPQPQHQAAPPPQPQHQAAPQPPKPPSPPPPQQAQQAPHPAPAPAPQPQQKPQPQGQQKPDEKK
ncbi:MAG: hypothetical protein E6G95_09605 [Alphaproteobacteria bacterium]|nr:MAG: hypothetical protein E6G95_09605 [Alphaproteobacteria bacterium]